MRLPVIASPTGGPKEILEHCENGLLVDVEDPKAIADALKKIIADQALWEKYSANGILATNQHVFMDMHIQQIYGIINDFLNKKIMKATLANKTAYGKKLAKGRHIYYFRS